MPLIDYQCAECGVMIEVLVRGSSRKKPVCPDCGSKNLERRISGFSTGGTSKGKGGDCCKPGFS